MLVAVSGPNESAGGLPERQFGWSNMFVQSKDDDPREQGGDVEGERDLLVRYLRDRRLTLEMKCAGLDPASMARRSVPPSNLSLLGLVRHMAQVEQFWFRIVMAGQDQPRHYKTPDDWDADFNGAKADPDLVADAWVTWQSEVAFAENLVDETPDLSRRGLIIRNGHPEGSISLRELLLHMIEEYARHLGHADFLRERIDGRVGQ